MESDIAQHLFNKLYYSVFGIDWASVPYNFTTVTNLKKQSMISLKVVNSASKTLMLLLEKNNLIVSDM